CAQVERETHLRHTKILLAAARIVGERHRPTFELQPIETFVPHPSIGQGRICCSLVKALVHFCGLLQTVLAEYREEGSTDANHDFFPLLGHPVAAVEMKSNLKQYGTCTGWGSGRNLHRANHHNNSSTRR
ncbi:unnamed protein product, partial [Ectocarpus sp. 4 AP-2014]